MNAANEDNQQCFGTTKFSGIEEDIVAFKDDNSCSPEELQKIFTHKYKIHDEPGVTYDNSYVISLAKDNSFTCIAAGLSDGSVRLFEVNSEQGLYITPPVDTHSLTICGVRFADETSNLLLVGTTNGIVRLIDLRTKNEVMCFANNVGRKGTPMNILSFDCNSNSHLLAMGSVQCEFNLVFYDMRKFKYLFQYCESHEDDLTSLRFHPDKPKLLCSGSTDGLINIYDVTANEDDAILTTINTNNSVGKVNWHTNINGSDIISCITDTNDFKAYNLDGDIIMDFNRLKITESIKRQSESNCYLANSFSTGKNEIMLLAGCNSKDGSVLRSCTINNNKLLPYANFEGNHQIVRESIFDDKTNILITAGEGGYVTLWTPVEWTPATTGTSLKIKTKTSNKFAPY